jgi:guanylate kinase
MDMKGKLVLFAAPSGSGKTTIVRHLLRRFPQLAFSVSATTRKCRADEEDGRDYYFLTKEDFLDKVAAGSFVEWEEVYGGQYYGTLRSEIERIWQKGLHVIFDVDVKGALKLKEAYPDCSLSVFVKPPSMEVVRERLMSRGSETPQTLAIRMSRVEEELAYEPLFDKVLLNEVLATALSEAEMLVATFLEVVPVPLEDDSDTAN